MTRRSGSDPLMLYEPSLDKDRFAQRSGAPAPRAQVYRTSCIRPGSCSLLRCSGYADVQWSVVSAEKSTSTTIVA